MGAAGRKRILKEFDLDGMVGAYAAIYAELLGTPREARRDEA